MVILPPYQRQGHGAQLLQAAYKYCAAMNNVRVDKEPRNSILFLLISQPVTARGYSYSSPFSRTCHPQVVDVPVEDPSPAFRALRDYVDCKNALPLSQDVDFAQPDPTSWQKLLQVMLASWFRQNVARTVALTPSTFVPIAGEAENPKGASQENI